MCARVRAPIHRPRSGGTCAGAPDLTGTDSFTIAFAPTLADHSAAWFFKGVSTHFLVAVHAFLEMVHYGVWIVLIPLVGMRSRLWELRTIPAAPEPFVGARRDASVTLRPPDRGGSLDLLRPRLRHDAKHLLQRRDVTRARGNPVFVANGVTRVTAYLLEMLVGYLLTVVIETAVLLALLSRRHSIGVRLFAGIWLTACTYPVVWLVLPSLFEERWLYLVVAETFAPAAECLLFWFAFVKHQPREQRDDDPRLRNDCDREPVFVWNW